MSIIYIIIFKLFECSISEMNLTIVDYQERNIVRSVMLCSYQATWKGGTLMWMMPLHLYVNQNIDGDAIK